MSRLEREEIDSAKAVQQAVLRITDREKRADLGDERRGERAGYSGREACQERGSPPPAHLCSTRSRRLRAGAAPAFVA